MSKKRTIDAFFGPVSIKKQRVSSPLTDDDTDISNTTNGNAVPSTHATYPFPIAPLPASLGQELDSLPAKTGRAITNQPDVDLVYFEPYVPRHLAKELFQFLRSSLPFYRVEYKIRRGGTETSIRTPRYTTVFGLDATSRFSPTQGDDANEPAILDSATGMPLPTGRSPYRFRPRPMPACLDALRKSTERAVGGHFNFCLVNYYASGADSISFHSDDERFLGPDPTIASFSLGAARDFLMKHKPPPDGGRSTANKPLKFPLGSGDMILMRGPTQSNWLHSVPKRSGRNEADGGRINITFRKALVKAGTDNYYNYNVGTGPVYRWNEEAKEMRLWKP